MDNTDRSLPELMRRATDALETDSAGLVRRGMERGVRLRRRRTAGVAAAALSAAVLTGGVIVAASSIGPDRSGPPVAGTPNLPAPSSQVPSSPVASSKLPPPVPVTSSTSGSSEKTLVVLRRLVPATFKVSDLEHRGDKGFSAASLTVDDGKGLSELSVLIERRANLKKHCPGPVTEAGYCAELPDGSVVFTRELDPVYAPNAKFPGGRHPNDRGVKYNSIELHRRDGLLVAMTSFTSRDEKDSPNTRSRPPFSVEQLTKLAQNRQWKAAAPAMPTR